jgi:hypothetical protein
VSWWGRSFIAAAAPLVARAISDGALRATDPDLFLQMMFASIAVPLLAPAIRDDGDGGASLRQALADHATRMFVAD